MSRTLPSAHELVEWLQDMRRFASKDADRATALLERLREAADDSDELYRIRDLCWQAGILERGDETTDILPLLAMFVPPAGA